MKLRILRWSLAIGAWIFCAQQVKTVLRIGGGIESFAPLLFAFAALIAGVLLTSPEIIWPICHFFADRFIDVIFPGSHASKPPLSYLLAHRYRDQFRLAEAIAEYQKILHYYPREKDAYIELLQLANEIGDKHLFKKYNQRFRRRFKYLPMQ